MTKIKELLNEADPLRHEPTWTFREREQCRRAVLGGALSSAAASRPESPSRIVFTTVIAGVAVASFLSVRMWSPFVGELQAAVRFEIRLAEDTSMPGLRQEKSSRSDRSIYLHDEAVVRNNDIAAARVVQGNGPSQYWVSVDFTPQGAAKMRSATTNHIGRPIAILLDGHVAAAPVLRTPIAESAVISGDFTRAEAERIVKGIKVK